MTRHERSAEDQAQDMLDRLIRDHNEMLRVLNLCLDREDIADDELGDEIRAVIAKAEG